MSPIQIENPNDPRLEPFRDVRERDLIGRRGLFLVEGKVTLNVFAARSRFAAESVLLLDRGWERAGDELQATLSKLSAAAPIYVIPGNIYDQIAGFPMHRGVLAAARRGPPIDPSDLLSTSGPRTVLILAGLSNHDNVGACFRNAAAFGADAILLDAESCDPLYRKSIRVSAGAALWLPFAQFGSPLTLVDLALEHGFDVWSLTPREGAADISALRRPDRLAIVLGAEGPGLDEAVIAKGRPVRIPMAADVDSLNVATAGAVALSWAMAAR